MTSRLSSGIGLCLALVLGLGPVTTPAEGTASGFVIDGFELRIDVRDAVAVTRASLTATNPQAQAVEIQLELPLSTSAVLTNFTLATHNATWVGHVVERAQAQTTYNASKASGQTAALLKSAGKGLLSVSVNVAARSTVRLNATYLELLPLEEGVQAYAFPLARLGAAHGRIASLVVHADVESRIPWNQASASGVPASLLANANRTRATLDYTAEAIQPANDLALEVRPSASGYTSDLVVSAGDRDAFFALRILPPGFGTRPIPLDIVFVLDHSGSMSGTKILQAKDALATILDQLRPADRFGLVKFDDEVTHWKAQLQAADQANRADSIAWVSEVNADGSTNLEGGVAAALEILGQAESAAIPMVVLITDGLPTAGITDHRLILESIDAKNARGSRVHTVGIGFDRDDAFLSEMALSSRGFYEPVGSDEDVEEALGDFYARIATPVLKDVAVGFQGISPTDVHPSPLPDVYQGSHLVLAGRADTSQLPPEIVVTLSGRDANGPSSHTIRLPTADLPIRPEVDRLWARQKANSLERAMERSSNETQRAALRAQLLEVGLRYQIETVATGWIIVAPEVADVVPAEGEPPKGTLTGAGGGTYRIARGMTTGTGGTTGSIALDQADGADPTGASSPVPKTPAVGLAGLLAVVALALALRRRRP